MLVAGVVTGFTGFAFNLLAVPLLVLVVPVREAIGLGLVTGVVVGVILAWRHRADTEWRVIAPLLCAGGIGLVVGVFASAALPEDLLRVCVGLFTVVFAIYLLVRPKPKLLSARLPITAGVGVVSGALTSVTGMGGPPIVAYLTHTIEHPRHVRASVATYIVAVNFVAAMALGAAGAMPTASVWMGLALAPAAVIGMLAGTALFHRIPRIYPRIVAGTLLATAFAGATLALTS